MANTSVVGNGIVNTDGLFLCHFVDYINTCVIDFNTITGEASFTGIRMDENQQVRTMCYLLFAVK